MNQKMGVRLNIIVCFFLTIIRVICAIKLCENEIDYYIPFSANCWDNPADRYSIADTLEKLFGFYTEEHYLTTKDGYTLSLVRFYWIITKKNPVILGHGSFSNGFSYLVAMENSLAYILGTEGYECWLVNFRGSKYSRNHTKFTVDEDQFWEFSFHEVGVFDLAAVADYVYEKTKSKSLYVGTSMGSATFATYSSVKSSEARERLLGAVLLTPAIKFTNQNSTALCMDSTISNIPYILPPRYHHGAIGYDSMVQNIFRRVIAMYPIFMRTFNYWIFSTIVGYNPEAIDWSHYPLLITTGFDISTRKIMNHFGQSIRSGEFRYFDYGEENMKKYNQEKPPLYPLENIEVPTAIIAGQGDLLTPLAGAKKFYEDLPTKIKCGFHIVKDPSFSHADIVASLNVRENMIEPVLEYLRKMESGSC